MTVVTSAADFSSPSETWSCFRTACGWAEPRAVSPALRLIEAPLGSVWCDELHRVLHLKGRPVLMAVLQKMISLSLGEKNPKPAVFLHFPRCILDFSCAS